ncbi:MAG: DUF2252 family protein [Burkholderiales bacterium]|nr:DUF2252 family protein [Burkholderiales bacterium]
MAGLRSSITLALCLISMAAHGATDRPSWVTSEIYNYNHRFAATDSVELAAKMSTMAQSPFQFYRGTDHIFFKDMATLPGSAYTTVQTGYAWLGGDTHIGKALAVAHALADQDYDSAVVPYSIDKQVADAVTSKSGLKSEIVSFAFSYVQQVQFDWQAFVSAYNAGMLLY